jgi:hypothetical protein
LRCLLTFFQRGTRKQPGSRNDTPLTHSGRDGL